MAKCRANATLQYIKRICTICCQRRHYAADMSLDQAVERAVDECIREGILAEFLTRNRNEVISMSIFEYDKELERRNYGKQNMKLVSLRVKNMDMRLVLRGRKAWT